MIKPVDILHELSKERAKQQEALLAEAMDILGEAAKEDAKIRQQLAEKQDRFNTPLNLRLLDDARIYSEHAIAVICTRYRLRFLDARFFKGDFPYEAVRNIKRFKKTVGTDQVQYKIVAPGEMFMLEDSNKDPLLFAQLGNDRFYLLHKWGSDISPLRNIFHFPFRNIATLAVTSFAIALVCALLIPVKDMLYSHQNFFPLILMYKAMICFILSGMVFTIAMIYGIVTCKDFSENTWNSKYFN